MQAIAASASAARNPSCRFLNLPHITQRRDLRAKNLRLARREDAQGARLARGVARSELLERGVLVGGVVVDVQPRVGEPPVVQVGEQVVDEAPFRRGVVRPPRGELPGPVEQPGRGGRAADRYL